MTIWCGNPITSLHTVYPITTPGHVVVNVTRRLELSQAAVELCMYQTQTILFACNAASKQSQQLSHNQLVLHFTHVEQEWATPERKEFAALPYLDELMSTPHANKNLSGTSASDFAAF